MKPTITTQRALRELFWAEHPHLSRKRITYAGERVYKADTRAAWVDWIVAMQRDGQISAALAQRATLY